MIKTLTSIEMDTSSVNQFYLSTFTPSNMSQASLEGMFVQREQLLNSVVHDLTMSVDGLKQYLMLVGTTGRGKTHFVSLVYHRLKQIPKLQDRLLIAWLPEQQYGVNSWLYLTIEIFRSLSPEGIDTKEQINKLALLPIAEAEYLANRILTEVIGDRTLLIIVENTDKLLFSLGEREQWKFCSFLQENNCCSILATTSKVSDDTSKKSKPFFGFFTSIHLPNFTYSDVVTMLIRIANLSENTQLFKFLNTDEGRSRVRALHHLMGDNLRTYTLINRLIAVDTLEVLLPAIVEVLDKLTPYYQSKIESLKSEDQQKIVMYLSRQTRAVTVKEIADQCCISSERTTSNALKKLKDKEYLISTQQGREVFYEISEILMRLCLEMKNARSGYLELCVDFIQTWYHSLLRQEDLQHLEADEIERQKAQIATFEAWHHKGLLLFQLGKYDEALTNWQEFFNSISHPAPSNVSNLIQQFLDEQLLPKFQQPTVGDILPQLISIYATAQVIPELGVALIRNLQAIQSPTISNYTAIEWLKMWQQLGSSYPKLALVLKILEAGIKYQQNPLDERVFLSLPQEIRPLFSEVVGKENRRRSQPS